jgi:hypothetical protein
MAKDYGLQEIDLRGWVAISNDWKELAKQDILDVVFMLYQSMNETWNNSCELNHISVK